MKINKIKYNKKNRILIIKKKLNYSLYKLKYYQTTDKKYKYKLSNQY